MSASISGDLNRDLKDKEDAFLAGDAHGFARAVKMLREFKDERNSLRIPALHMADWLEKQEKGDR